MLKVTIFFAIFFPFVSAANPKASVVFFRNDGSSCYGTCLESKSRNVVATVAHCLDNFHNGGVTLHGRQSIGVIVDPAVYQMGVSLDNDFALVEFPHGTCLGTARPDYTQQQLGSTVNLPLISNTPFSETVEGYVYNSTNQYFALLKTTNRSQLKADEAGAGLFNQSGEYLGALRSCDTTSCVFVPVLYSNPVVSQILGKAMHDKLIPRLEIRSPAILPKKPSPSTTPK